MCLIYPGTRWFIGREELKRLRESTLFTFFKVCKKYGVKTCKQFVEGGDPNAMKYNGQDHFIELANGSRIDLLELKYLPSDPLFERYGSAEFTGGWIEEAGETVHMAYDTLKSRIGRHLNDKYNILPKIFVTFNPKKNYVYNYFYKRDKDHTLPAHVIFIKALLFDNPFRESEYEQQLLDMSSKSQKERLLHGNFEYDDDPAVLCDYDAIADMFTNEHVLPGRDIFISEDLAMQGRDKQIGGKWEGLVCTIIHDRAISTGKSIETDLKNAMIKYNVPRSRVVVDSDGMGNYLESYLTGIKEFHGNATPNEKEFKNLKSECAYKLAELINKRLIKIICTAQQRESIMEEVAVLKAADVDNDERKKSIISKDDMKELLGRSPDYLDMLIMRMYFEVAKKAPAMMVYRD
jgi:hypothetical protein